MHVEKQGTQFKAVAAIESKLKTGEHLLGEILEHGTGRISPRPYKQKIIDNAMPKIKQIYTKPYKGG